jgi:hypothetical protein
MNTHSTPEIQASADSIKRRQLLDLQGATAWVADLNAMRETRNVFLIQTKSKHPSPRCN